MSKVILERIEPIEESFARLREAPLDAADCPDLLIYKNASMRFCEFEPEELNLTSLYVLKENLASLRGLRSWLLNEYGIDLLQPTGVLHLRSENGELTGLAPPFVEIYEEMVEIVPGVGDRIPPPISILKVPILKDGIHRAWLAREEGVLLRCVLVSGADELFKPYAYPNGWPQVKLYDEKPKEKKFYRRQAPYSYLRPIKVLRQIGDKPPANEWGR